MDSGTGGTPGESTGGNLVSSKVTQENIKDLSDFVVTRVLSNNGNRKTICAVGKLADSDENGVLFLEKLSFSEEVLKGLCSKQSLLKKEFLNDVYGSYTCLPDVNLNGIKVTFIYPATDKHIAKYESRPHHIIEETPQFYNEITLPHIISGQFNLEWVYNILDHKKEEERIIFEDDDPEKGFILLPDIKWDGKQVDSLYLLCIVRKRGIRSLRDLNGEHLPLLINIKDKGSKVIYDKYSIPESQLRIYIHYQPTFYHLHIHFTYLNFEAPGIFAEKSHLLSTVINNIQLNSKYYKIATLPFAVSESQSLFSAYEEKGK
ncbi:hypothetical protein AAG570_001259 [Ranatra chinensis]|uniref:m7GpppX diphosphatase n=1 Tax=Ranatra chinensis TaxID=642074 RepID=A0ABD0YBC3_9HEMI